MADLSSLFDLALEVEDPTIATLPREDLDLATADGDLALLTGAEVIKAAVIRRLRTPLGMYAILIAGYDASGNLVNIGSITATGTLTNTGNATISGTLGIGGNASMSAFLTLDAAVAKIGATNMRDLVLGGTETGGRRKA